MTVETPLPPLPLPEAIRARRVEEVNGLTVHVLEAGRPGDPVALLLHGFPELAYSWRAVMPALAAAGFHVIAPDQRGFGRTTGWDDRYDGDLASFRQGNLVTDALALLAALGVGQAALLVGHDFGAIVAGWAGLIRPDVFPRVVLMSAPFTGPPPINARADAGSRLDAALAALTPPRRHYRHYYGLPEANADMLGAPEGLHAFIRAYFHFKSGDHPGNRPFSLGAPTPEAFAQLQRYYVMDRDRGMAETVAAEAPDPEAIAAATWLPEADVAVYAAEFARTGFQGGLNWYRANGDPTLRLFAGRTLDTPALFIGGARDWGVYQSPGAFEAMAGKTCTHLVDRVLIPGAGHWVQQEAPEAVIAAILDFAGKT